MQQRLPRSEPPAVLGRVPHEHIYWDQASVLVLVGLPDRAKLSAAGAETARKVLDRTAPSNMLLGDARRQTERREVGSMLALGRASALAGPDPSCSDQRRSRFP
jgi:hypothetical protein